MKNHLFTYPAILSLTALVCATSAMAEPPRGQGPGGEWHHGPPGAEQQLSQLDQALDLSDEQSADLLAVLQAADAKEGASASWRVPPALRADADTDADIWRDASRPPPAVKDERRQHKEYRGHRFGDLDCAAAGMDPDNGHPAGPAQRPERHSPDVASNSAGAGAGGPSRVWRGSAGSRACSSDSMRIHGVLRCSLTPVTARSSSSTSR
jgi:hypothetical protein